LDFRSRRPAKSFDVMDDGADNSRLIRACQGRAAKVGSGDPAPLGARVGDCGRRFIVVFEEFFNGHLWPRRLLPQSGLKWLYHRQNNNQDHERRRGLVQYPIETGQPHIGILGESANAAREIAVQPSQAKNQNEFRLPPAVPPIFGQINERKPGQKDEDHGRRDDGFEKPPLHHLERFRDVRAPWRIGVIDEQPGEIQHPRHPRDDGDDVQSLNPEDHAEFNAPEQLGWPLE
jgi:hypothetical protein